ncbi:MAG: hypothetical protein ABJZ55_18680 [Fuerstiella sp.]
MCIFAQPVVSVTDTNIFARLLPGGWQSLVYQMDFASQAKNAIILPIPVQLPASDEDSLQFISLKEYDTFFADLNRLFPLALPSRPKSRSVSGLAADSAVKTLRVQEVGDFVASFVPTLSDFHRLDQQFRLPQESWDQIPAYSNYGFAVFQLKSLNGKPHPMAFKFKSQLRTTQPKSVFFPTVHIHDGQVHDRERFDHTLYLQSPDFDQACGRYIQHGRHVPDSATGYTRSKWAAAHSCDLKKSQGILNAQGLVHRHEMRGMFKNTDVVVNGESLRKNAGIPTTNQSLAALAAAGGFAGMKWFFDRRKRVAQQEGV